MSWSTTRSIGKVIAFLLVTACFVWVWKDAVDTSSHPTNIGQQQKQQQKQPPTNATLHNTPASVVLTTVLSPPATATNASSSSTFASCVQDLQRRNVSGYVLQNYKLILFPNQKVGGTVWKMFLRRVMGATNWNAQNDGWSWKEKKNGLYLISLAQYSQNQLVQMFQSPSWTRAIFVRDPIERFVSAYKDKTKRIDLMNRYCRLYYQRQQQQVPNNIVSVNVSGCVQQAKMDPAFFFQVVQNTKDPHWLPQSRRLPRSCWENDGINFVGRFETLAVDAQRLLQRLHAWDLYGSWGWGPHNESIFSPSATVGRGHGTGATSDFISPALQARLVEYYREDYEHPFLNFTRPAV